MPATKGFKNAFANAGKSVGNYIRSIFHQRVFCCCVPVRVGVIAMSLLSILVSGILSIIIWFEVTTNHMFSSTKIHAAVIIAGILETILCLASVLGFVGAIVRKQSFVAVYSHTMLVHFLVTIGVAGYLLYMVTHAEQEDIMKACQEGLQNHQAQDQCTNLLRITKGAVLLAAMIVLLIEMYGALIVTRYLNQIKAEKRTSRAVTQMAKYQKHVSYTGSVADQSMGLLHGRSNSQPHAEFDPYADYTDASPSSSSHNSKFGVDSINRMGVEEVEDGGYGGGHWTYEEISKKEKEADLERGLVYGHQEEDVEMPSHLVSPPRSPEPLPPYESRWKSFGDDKKAPAL